MNSNALNLNIPGHLYDLAAKEAKAGNFISTEAYILHMLEDFRQFEKNGGTHVLQDRQPDGQQDHNADLGFNEASEGNHLYALSLGFNDADDQRKFGETLNSDELSGDAKGTTAEEITE